MTGVQTCALPISTPISPISPSLVYTMLGLPENYAKSEALSDRCLTVPEDSDYVRVLDTVLVTLSIAGFPKKTEHERVLVQIYKIITCELAIEVEDVNIAFVKSVNDNDIASLCSSLAKMECPKVVYTESDRYNLELIEDHLKGIIDACGYEIHF